jgi:hypothetical protein
MTPGRGAALIAAMVAAAPLGASALEAQARPGRRPAALPLAVVADTLAVCRLPLNESAPAWAEPDSGFVVLVRTPTERSVILSQRGLPAEAACERDYRPVRVAGELPLDLVGVVARMTRPLADAGISLMALSTHETDYVLVKAADLDRAVRAWRRAGHTVRR